ncbi:unnamed protein product [Ceratitis capitata]|uniref:(Mediterranean fruit fly) hypothetical protein n=1 Tax=Ceratitis capitata TaxID=7213 RepID=A0A811V0N9_CERCA|nr:unnamed protein product [Ceratitis capitata]
MMANPSPKPMMMTKTFQMPDHHEFLSEELEQVSLRRLDAGISDTVLWRVYKGTLKRYPGAAPVVRDAGWLNDRLESAIGSTQVRDSW